MSDLTRLDVGDYLAGLVARVRRHTGETPEVAQMEEDLKRFRDTTEEGSDAGRGQRYDEQTTGGLLTDDEGVGEGHREGDDRPG